MSKKLPLIFITLVFLKMGSSVKVLTQKETLSHICHMEGQKLLKAIDNFQFFDTNKKNLKLFLYSKSNEPVPLKTLSQIDANHPTKMIVHGWLSNGTVDWIQNMSSIFHQKGPYYVVGVDWSQDASQNYLHAAGATRSIGFHLGDEIMKFQRKYPDFVNRLHIIGHSLGAHVAGFAGKKVAKYRKRVARVTGLDPASPLFEFPVPRSSNSRLSKNDARFVDLIHTSMGLLGVASPYGNSDFYLNSGGPIQPECLTFSPIDAVMCSHQIAHQVYAETILERQKYEALGCPNSRLSNLGACVGNQKNYMGDGVEKKIQGSYFVSTLWVPSTK